MVGKPSIIEVVLSLSLLGTLAYAQAPVLDDGTYQPDPNSTTYAQTVSARPQSHNARGLGAGLSATLRVADQVQQLESESYSFSIRILNLPGRAGLNLALHFTTTVAFGQ